MSVVTYSRLSNFQNGLSLSKLSTEINADSALAAKFTKVSTFNTDVRIFFSSTLLSGEQTDLDTIVSNHQYVIEDFQNIISVSPITTPIRSPSFFRRVGSLVYDPDRRSATIVKVELIANGDAGITSYSVRLVDITNNTILGTASFNNTSEASVELNTFSNIPDTKSILEVHIRTFGGTESDYVHINSIELYIG